jgi:repressor LexA
METSMTGLTDRQAEVLDFIDSFTKRHSYAPTIREVGEHFKMSGKSAYDHITALKRKGFVVSDSGKARTLVV